MAEHVTTLADLIKAVRDLEQLDDVARIGAARSLARSIPGQLARLADEWTYDLTRHRTALDVARTLGVSRSQVSNAVTRHNREFAARAGHQH
jgi:hypothetical protein